MYFSKDADSIPTFESPWIHRGWTPAHPQLLQFFFNQGWWFSLKRLSHSYISSDKSVPVCSAASVVSDSWHARVPWTADYQAPPSMGFSRQEYWSGVPGSSPDGSRVIRRWGRSRRLWKNTFLITDIERLEMDSVVGRSVKKKRLNNLDYVE